MRQQFNEDRAELEAHFSERVHAYIELGETPEQAQISAREKFGETETVIRTLRWQKVLPPKLVWSFVIAAAYVLATYLGKAAHLNNVAWGVPIFTLVYALYMSLAFKNKRCR